MDRVARSEMELEALGLVPSDVRQLVIDRDASCCRVCGRYVEYPHLHHVEYRSEGGLDVPANLVTLGGGFPSHDCHGLVHSNKRLWQPLLQRVLTHDGFVTALQLRRWHG